VSFPLISDEGENLQASTIGGSNQRFGPEAFHILAKPRGAICNLRCRYCFYTQKADLYRGGTFRMSEEVLESYIRQTLQAHRVPEVTIAWQGGEPTLMGLDFFKRSIAIERRYARPGQRIINTIQTNGIILDDDWCAFLHDHNFLVGISIDGPKDLHDQLRVDMGGGPTFDRVMKGLRLLQKHRVEHNALVTINSANVDEPLRVYRFLRDEAGFHFLQFIPIVERTMGDDAGTTRKVTKETVSPGKYGRFMIGVFDEWVRHDVGQVFVQAFDVALANWHGEPPSVCTNAAICGTALALEHNGDLYSCDHFVDGEHLLGNIIETPMVDLVGSEKQQIFGSRKAALPQYCLECDVRFACHGGCPKDRISRTPGGETGLNYLCSGYKSFYHHIDRPMRAMSHLLRQGRAPSEIMIKEASPK
jgi:serine-type anaerobic sulfatase-maturating enzyme